MGACVECVLGVLDVLNLLARQVARLMKANQQTFHNEREAFYVELPGFDVHANAVAKL